MVNIDLVCQKVPKWPLQARVSRGAVATAITACGFVTRRQREAKLRMLKGCNSDYRLLYKEKDITTFMVVMSLFCSQEF